LLILYGGGFLLNIVTFMSQIMLFVFYLEQTLIIAGSSDSSSSVVPNRKIKNTQNIPSIVKFACAAAPLYVFGFWVRHGLLQVYRFGF
jgi:hypothetical protein